MFDYDQLLANSLIRAVLSPEEVQRANEDEDWLVNTIQGNSDSVLVVRTDSAMPGTCSVMCINEWRGLYFFVSSDVDPEGPFANLEEALDVEWFCSFTPDNEIWSKVIPLERLLEIVSGRFSDGCGNTIMINNCEYVLDEEGVLKGNWLSD